LKDSVITIVGIIGGIIGSLLIMLKLIPKWYPPTIEISKNIAYSEESGSKRYRIKIKNLTKNPIRNISSELQFVYKKESKGFFTTITISLVKSDILILPQYDLNDKYFDFCYTFLVSHSNNTYDLIDLFDKHRNNTPTLRFRIIATHYLSGFSKIFESSYKLNSIKKGYFKTDGTTIMEEEN